MRKTKKAVAAILTLLLIVSMTACALHGKNLTMDALVNASTRDEVIELLGDSFSAAGDSDWYESVEYMGEPYSMLVSYCDNTLDNIAMHCNYEGMRGMDLVLERLNYTVTARERQLAKNALEEVACELTEKYGEPEVYYSPVETTTRSWYVGDCEIELEDHTGNDQFKALGAYEILIWY